MIDYINSEAFPFFFSLTLFTRNFLHIAYMAFISFNARFVGCASLLPSSNRRPTLASTTFMGLPSSFIPLDPCLLKQPPSFKTAHTIFLFFSYIVFIRYFLNILIMFLLRRKNVLYVKKAFRLFEVTFKVYILRFFDGLRYR